MTADARAELDLRPGWTRQWTATWVYNREKVTVPVSGLTSMPARGCVPVRGFTFSPEQRHRPGTEVLVSTVRQHGYESQEERMLLRALDFAGGLREVQSQPFSLCFSTAAGSSGHIPDYLAYTDTGLTLIDVRPSRLIREDDRIKFAAAAEVALVMGWRYLVVGGWQRFVVDTLDELFARRRPMKDPMGMQDQVLAQLGPGPRRFDEIIEATSVPAIARTHLSHLIWWRRAVIDLSRPLGDSCLVWAPRPGSW
ncbi:TnsA-like heteromeric transposase endonuclease subunit [Actinoplanes palleronii]|uniref:TnsA-like heteromeric transposase endonuclease subunit n=1 Tax=Actinoplanes palleronii TaxID=113570 RepID=UPI0019457097|nr:TnsA-like heteromeric transposase endonuclease subunit [Actinoplanes palleronii]